MMQDAPTIAVVGAGSWGTALASRLAKNGVLVHLWGRDRSVCEQINQTHTTPYLAGIILPENLKATTDLTAALNGVDIILIAVPSGALRGVCDQINQIIQLSGYPVCWASKGIDPQTSLTFDQLLKSIYHVKDLALISGPSFAQEVALNMPTAINIVSNSSPFQKQLAKCFQSACFRVYLTQDFIGSQICAIFKNVLAIASGISDGLNMGYNARAALLTRALEEMKRLVIALGGDVTTVYGLCGLGDLLLTATGDLSRNRQFGLALAKTSSVDEAAQAVGKTIEGQANIHWLLSKADEHAVELPICAAVGAVLDGKCSPREGVQQLLERATPDLH